MTHKPPILLAMAFVLACLPLLSAHASDTSGERSDALHVARQATQVLDKIELSPERALPERLLRNAKAVVVVPSVVKAGLVIGARHGEGVVSVRRSDGTWSYPVFVDLSGGSIGFQAGVSSTDVVLVFRTQRGVDGLVRGKFTLGGNIAVAAGPVGRNAHAATDAQFDAEIYSYSRSHGLFAGVSLDGTALTIDYDALAAIYGPDITPRRVFEGGVSDVPTAVKTFRDHLVSYTVPKNPVPAATTRSAAQASSVR